jgi:hypothetical protein
MKLNGGNLKSFYQLKAITLDTLWKKYIEQLRYNTPSDSVLLYVEENGPIAAKTHSGSSWSSTQVKIEKAQKIRGLLNVFGAYDHTDDKMHMYIVIKRRQVNSLLII